MDIEFAVDAMALASNIDQTVLFSGDGEFRSLVEAIRRRGVCVTVVLTPSTNGRDPSHRVIHKDRATPRNFYKAGPAIQRIDVEEESDG